MKTKMTKAIYATLMMLFFAGSMFAQSVGINDNGSNPDSKAMLDVSSTTKGLLPPRMTYAQKTAITSPPAGLMVWCSNCGTNGELQVYNGTSWTSLTAGTPSGLPGAPTIGTATAGNAQATVTFSAPVSNGGSAITLYTATSNPDSKTGTSITAGTITITGLTNGTPYTFTVTATNATGTGEASAASNSVTPAALVCPASFIDARDSKVYTAVLIGTQCWMAQNLNVGTRIDGATNQTDNSTREKYCYANSEANCDVYGGLYQWAEMAQYYNGATNTTTWSAAPAGNLQGLCPSGWHLPTTAEWNTLLTNVGGASVAGDKLKESGTAHWTSPNTGATNESGFTALPGGELGNGNIYIEKGDVGRWGTLTQAGTSAADRFIMGYNFGSVVTNNVWKYYGSSVRCVKD